MWSRSARVSLHIERALYFNIKLIMTIKELFIKTIYSHGKEFSSCAYCDKELTLEEPGERIMYIMDHKRIIEHTCRNCFNGSDYQELIRDISNQYGMDIRSFPQMID
jgi:hypothetical protein